jgi:hypothetical protein
MIIGKSQNGDKAAATGGGTGTLTMGAGTFDVNTIEAGYEAGGPNSPSSASGTINIRTGGTLRINNSLRLAYLGTSQLVPKGILNIFGGDVTGAGSIIAGGGNSTIAISSNGTLNVSGSVGTLTAPINNLLLTNAVLNLAVTPDGVPSVVANNVTTAGNTVLNITSLPTGVSLPATFPLIKYLGTFNGLGFSGFTLGLSSNWQAALVDNPGNQSVDLQIYSAPTQPYVTSVNKVNSTLVINGTGGVPGNFYYTLSSTNATLPVASWTRIGTNVLDGNGGFTYTAAITPSTARRFYIFQVP